MSNAKDLIADVVDLVALPETYLRIRELYEDPNSRIDTISDVVSMDPGISAKTLRIANSAFFGFATKIGSISRAITIMGTAELHDIVLATSAISSFNKISTDMVDMNTYWRSSLQCGIVARLLGHKCNILDSDRLFVTGLLHSIGHLLMYLKLPEQMSQVISQAKAQNKPWFALEREIIGFDYGEVGAELMNSWKLPESICYVIEHHIDPEQAEIYPLETAILHMASILSIKEALGTNAGGQVPNISYSALQATPLNSEDLDAAVKESEVHIIEALSMFMPDK